MRFFGDFWNFFNFAKPLSIISVTGRCFSDLHVRVMSDQPLANLSLAYTVPVCVTLVFQLLSRGLNIPRDER